MKYFIILLFFGNISCAPKLQDNRKVFDVHIHGNKDISNQLKELESEGVYKAAISSSWDLQNSYRKNNTIDLLFGLMFPCPNGKVPYSLQDCFGHQQDWPSLNWVEEQIKDGKIDFLGEVLSQYYGISSSDSLLYNYYDLANKYQIPVGVHTGGAGPGHGSPNFSLDLGNPLLLKGMLTKYPALKVWIMHAGDQFNEETIAIMKDHPQVYADISVLSNPDIVPFERFAGIMKSFVDEGLEDRLMFGSDNGNINDAIASVERLVFLSRQQKEQIYYQNAEQFFKK